MADVSTLCHCGKKFKHIGACQGAGMRAAASRKTSKFQAAIDGERSRLQAVIGKLRNGIKRQQDELVAVEAKLEGLRAAAAAYAQAVPSTSPEGRAVRTTPTPVPFRVGERA